LPLLRINYSHHAEWALFDFLPHTRLRGCPLRSAAGRTWSKRRILGERCSAVGERRSAEGERRSMQYCEEKRVEKKIKAPCRLVLP
jgi:hypothetical protein